MLRSLRILPHLPMNFLTLETRRRALAVKKCFFYNKHYSKPTFHRECLNHHGVNTVRAVMLFNVVTCICTSGNRDRPSSLTRSTSAIQAMMNTRPESQEPRENLKNTRSCICWATTVEANAMGRGLKRPLHYKYDQRLFVRNTAKHWSSDASSGNERQQSALTEDVPGSAN